MSITVSYVQPVLPTRRWTHGVEEWWTSLLNAFIRRREEQRAIRHLQALDDHLLRDIGIHRSEIASVVSGRERDLTRRRNLAD